ncbi:MAG: DUF1003 domain-containing protein [Saprospiraceae bacterium]|nr:DUF1003 domain-containing protein [Saprospiraceae bacterium]
MRKNDQHYIDSLLKTENQQLDRLHEIVRLSIEEEEMITRKLCETDESAITFGERLSDKVAKFGGSWRFIIIFMAVLWLWIIVNSVFLASKAFDPYPYILMNLILSCIAAIQAPIIMMSQNRKELKDRQRAENDYMVNLKSEIEIRNLHRKMDLNMEDQFQHLFEIQQKQLELMQQILIKLEKK